MRDKTKTSTKKDEILLHELRRTSAISKLSISAAVLPVERRDSKMFPWTVTFSQAVMDTLRRSDKAFNEPERSSTEAHPEIRS